MSHPVTAPGLPTDAGADTPPAPVRQVSASHPVRASTSRRPAPEPAPAAAPRRVLPGAAVPPGLQASHRPALSAEVLDAMESGAVVVDADNQVVVANSAAMSLGVVVGTSLAVDGLADLVVTTRASGRSQTAEVTLVAPVEFPLSRPRPDQEPPAARVTARLLRGGAGHVALVLEDVTDARRVAAVRRDFVANVSHELKTPVGALSLLAEAVDDAAADPVAVRRFAARMAHESHRLSRLVQELIDLSRLQGADPLPPSLPVRVALLVSEAVDRTRLGAAVKDIRVDVRGLDPALAVLGDERQLVTAVVNLLDNAIAYSPNGTRVVLGLRRRDDGVELSVTDEGMGISEADQERVFERFYRADPARSRRTGGTGLGLAIVKHIVTNHGGTVSVWSSEGAGSTFTVRLPAPGNDAEQHADGGLE